jgi:hypothetical protein
MTCTISLAICLFEYSTWLFVPFGFDDCPYPLKSAATMVKRLERAGATKRQILLVIRPCPIPYSAAAALLHSPLSRAVER